MLEKYYSDLNIDQTYENFNISLSVPLNKFPMNS